MKYSVIIPVYEAEQTISRCLDSVLSQAYDDVEVLLINDGSTDASESICKKYVDTYENVFYYTEENRGVSSARNYGLDLALGDYILFVDSDDYVTNDYFSSIDAVLSTHEYDLVQFSNYIDNNDIRTSRIRGDFQACTREELFQHFMGMLHKKKSNQPWAKVYKHSIIKDNNIRFPENIEIGEDRAFLIHFSFFINSFCISSNPIYCVNTDNTDSLSRKQRSDLNEQIRKQHDYLNRILFNNVHSEKEKKEYEKSFHFDELRMVYTKAKNQHKDCVKFFKRLRYLRNLCKEIKKYHWSFPDNLYSKLLVFPVQHNLPIIIDLVGWKLAR